MCTEESKVVNLGRHNLYDMFHPLMGKAGITLNRLYGNCTSDAEEVLRIAARFLRFRIERQKEIERLCQKLIMSPWTGKHHPYKSPSSYLMPMDLARALMAHHTDELRYRLFGKLCERPTEKIRGTYEIDSRKWLEISRGLPENNDDPCIEKIWCRNWVATLSKDPDKVIDIPTLIGSLDKNVLRKLILHLENYGFLAGTMSESTALELVAESLHASSTPILSAMPQAYYDPEGNIQHLTESFKMNPGVFITTRSHSALKDLMRAWSVQAGAHWEDITPLNFPWRGIWLLRVSFGKDVPIVENVIDRYCPPEIFIPDDDFVCDPELDFTCLKVLVNTVLGIHIDPTSDQRKTRFAIVSTPGVCERLSRLHTLLNRLPMKKIPEIQMKDIVPMWLALKPRMEDLGMTLSLGEIFSILELFERKDDLYFKERICPPAYGFSLPVETIRWSNRDNVLDLFRNARLNVMHRQDQGEETHEKWKRLFMGIQLRLGEINEIRKSSGYEPINPLIDKYISTDQKLKRIVEMEMGLDSMCA